MTERRTDYDPAATCGYCGDRRDRHERVPDAWRYCAEQAAHLQAVA